MLRQVVGLAMLLSVPVFFIATYLLQEVESGFYPTVQEVAIPGVLVAAILTIVGALILGDVEE